jgi:hypothetical protein
MKNMDCIGCGEDVTRVVRSSLALVILPAVFLDCFCLRDDYS